MKERKRPVATVEAGLLTALAIIFTIIGTYVPFLTIFVTIVAVPLSLIGIRHGLRMLTPALIASSILSFMVGGLPTLMSVGLMAGASAFFISLCFQRKMPVSQMVIGVAIISIVTTAAYFQLLVSLLNIDILAIMETSMQQSAEMIQSISVEGVDKEAAIANMELLVETMRMIFPSMMVFIGAAYAFINIVALRFIMKRMKMTFLPAKPFNEFMFHRSVLIGTTLIMVLTYIAGVMKIVDLSVLFINVILIIAFTFSIQGIAVFDFILGKRNIPQGFRFLIIAVLYILFNGYIFLGIMGWFDVIFNFRKLELHDHLR